MKKFLTISMLICLVVCVLAGCGGDDNSSDKMEFEQLEWPAYENAKQIPIPKSTMADVRNKNSVRFEFYLANTTLEDYKDYVEECKAKGFTVEPVEQENRYCAFNEGKYELTVQYQEGDIMHVCVVEERYEVGIKLLHVDKTSADMYNIRVEIDGYWEKDSEQGDEAITFYTDLKEGRHTLSVENDDDNDINGRFDFNVSENGDYFEFEIDCSSNKIVISQFAGDAGNNTKADEETTVQGNADQVPQDDKNANDSLSEDESVTPTETPLTKEDGTESNVGLEPYEGAVKVCQKIKNSLNNQDSLQIHEVLHITYNGCDYYYIDLSAMNKMGGYTRTTYYAMFMDAVLFKLEEMKSFSYEDIITSEFDDLEYLDVETIESYLK